MRKLVWWIGLIAIIGAGLPVRAGDGQTAPLVAGNNAFAFDIYHQQAAASDANLILSPLSVSQAFAMVVAGARGDTERDIRQTFHFTLPPADLHPAFGAFRAELLTRESEGLQLLTANAVWGEATFPFSRRYLDTLQQFYGEGFHRVDFVNAPQDATEQINAWVAEQTSDTITDLIPSGMIDSLTRLVLVNAIYFNGQWAIPFDETLTADDTFFTLDGDKVFVPMMVQEIAGGLYLASKEYEAVELAYAGDQLAMLIILPEEDEFTEVEQALDAAEFDTIRASLAQELVILSMPRFAITTEIDLKATLMAMGLLLPFGESADFSGVYDANPVERGWLYITDAVQKAAITVSEAGTEAAAATAVMEGIRGAPEPVIVTLDRPFMYIIYDRPTGAIAFMGRVTNPAN